MTGAVLVTGAHGMVGSRLVPALLRAGRPVRAAVRRPLPAVPGAETAAVGEMGPDTGWGRALAGVEAVVHLANATTDAPGAERLERGNVGGTAALARCAAAAGVRRLVYVSSVKVHGEGQGGAVLREDSPPAPHGPYARSKWSAERELASVAERTGLEVVVLRPPMVYGPGVRGNFLGLLRAVARGVPLPLGAVRNRRSLIFVDNLVEALLLALWKPRAAGETFLVADEPLSTPDLVRSMARALGRPARLLPVPVALLRAAGRLSGRGGAVSRLTDSLVVDGTRIRAALGYAPPFGPDEAMERTAAWFRAHPHGA